MRRTLLFIALTASLIGPALAQSAALGDSAKALIGTWEFSNADRDKTCSATFKSDPTKVGFKVEFDQNCANLFPLVASVAGWTFPEGDLLRLLDAQGKVLVEFSEVEDGIYEAPTPGLGVLFLQNAAAAGPPPKQPDAVAGTWAVTRRNGAAVCTLGLSANPAKDGFALIVMPGCDASIARLNFTQWQLDRDQLMLVPARGNPWRFEEVEGGNWRRVPETADAITLVRQ
ncbi:MAG: AprI/Inh family metalloprotease inhibitor [Pseudolabrys sp.]